MNFTQVIALIKSLTNKTNYLADWDNSINYSVNDGVYYGGKIYKSLVDNNLNNTPTDATKWSEVTSSSSSSSQSVWGSLNL